MRGSAQLGICKRFLERYRWWEFEPHPEWVLNHADKNSRISLYAAGIPGEIRIIYMPISQEAGYISQEAGAGYDVVVQNIERNTNYSAFLFDPSTGEEYEVGGVTSDESGKWSLPAFRAPIFKIPIFTDLLLVLENNW